MTQDKIKNRYGIRNLMIRLFLLGVRFSSSNAPKVPMHDRNRIIIGRALTINLFPLSHSASISFLERFAQRALGFPTNRMRSHVKRYIKITPTPLQPFDMYMIKRHGNTVMRFRKY